jgi:DNA invertase Pin-like site-specific DNA recombinase
MAAVAQWERRAIGVRTRDALAARRAAGVSLGRPNELPDEVAEAMVQLHQQGAGWSAIARQLNDSGTPTAHDGAKWYPSTVRSVVLARSTTS